MPNNTEIHATGSEFQRLTDRGLKEDICQRSAITKACVDFVGQAKNVSGLVGGYLQMALT